MIISEKFIKELSNLQQESNSIIKNSSFTILQLENFLENLEKHRYNLLNEIKIYNRNVNFEYEKIKSIDNKYKSELLDDILKIYIPEVLPSYKNKTHAYKRLLLNVAEITKPFKGQFNNQVFIYIKVFNNINGWDIDNRNIKPIADALISSGVIKDDNISKMFYAVKGEYSENIHTEIYVFNSEKVTQFLENYSP